MTAGLPGSWKTTAIALVLATLLAGCSCAPGTDRCASGAYLGGGAGAGIQ